VASFVLAGLCAPIHAQTGDKALDAFAQKSGYDASNQNESSLEAIISKAINFGLSLVAVIFLGMLIYAGIRWMTAMGNDEKSKKAKDTIEAAVIGLVIVTLAYAITSLVFTRLMSMPQDNSTNELLGEEKLKCETDLGCAGIGVCVEGFCQKSAPASCTDDGCGGGCLIKCSIGKKCKISGDCESDNCEGGICKLAPVCTNIKDMDLCLGTIGCAPFDVDKDGENDFCVDEDKLLE
jgi:hypothetical protein